MTGGAAFRGQPLMLLTLVLGGWLALRLMLWEAPATPLREMEERSILASAPILVAPREAADADPPLARAPAPQRSALLLVLKPAANPFGSKVVALSEPRTDQARYTAPVEPALPAASLSAPATSASAALSAPVAVAAAMPGALVAPPPPPAAPPSPAGSSLKRWSGDSWLLLRQDDAPAVAAALPSYGRSQAGAVLRYRLQPARGHRPEAYVRASAALTGIRETELAAGVSARPIAGVPLRVAAEVRRHEIARGNEVRPAVYAVSELPPVALPGGLTAEAYLQAGYVGGDFATAFVDGQVRVDRALADESGLALRAGIGAWGGAQEGAERVDAGPTIALTVPLGRATARLSADYRWRLAGDAQPASGPALTLSAGF